MTKKKRRADRSRYRIWLKPSVHRARRRLPGNVRQRIQRLIDELGQDPRPTSSRPLKLPETLPSAVRNRWEVRRARIEDWRVVYAVDETWKELGVLAVARRPPYRYEDLEALLEDLGSAR